MLLQTTMDKEVEIRYPEIGLLITCSLCHNYLFEPRTLPCQHSFCYRCLNGYGKRDMYDQRGCECPSCGKVFYNLFLEDLKIDTKILLLQKIAGITTFDTSSASGQHTNGLHGQDSALNGKESVEEELLTIDGASNGNLQSGVRLEGLDVSDSDLENQDEASDSDIDSSLEDEMDGNLSEYLSSESESDPEQDEKLLESSNLEVVQQVFDDDELDQRQFETIFKEKPEITKTLDIRHKKELKEPFVHDLSITRDGNVFVVDINNNVVKCCDSEGLILKKTPKKLTFKPIRLCELYTGEMLVVEMSKFGRGKISSLKRSLSNKDGANKEVLRSLKKICVVRQMPEDRKRFYCGDSDGFVHRVNLKSPEMYHKFHSVLPRVYHMAAANSLIAVNDGNLQGTTSKIVRIFDEQGNLQWSYSGTKNHPFVYHGDMVFHGDYLLICDFWSSKLHMLFLPNEIPARVMNLKQDLGLVFPSSITTTVDHKLVLAAQKAGEKDKKSLIFTVDYLS